MEKITTVIDEKANKELAKPTRILSYIIGFLGAACIGFYITFSALTKTWGDALNIVLVIVGAIFLLFGVYFDHIITKALKRAKADPFTSISDFQDEYVFIEIFKNEEKMSEGKIYYNTIKRMLVRKNYIYLVGENRMTYVFTKSDELLDFLSKTGVKKL